MRAHPSRLVPAGLLLLVASGAPAPLASAPPPAPPKPPPSRSVPAYTDDDLDRYREERLRRESTPPDAGEPTGPAPGDTSGATAGGRPAPATSPVSASVEIQDLNRTLPPAARKAAEEAGQRFIAFFGLPVGSPLVIPLRYFPDAAAFRDHVARNLSDDVGWTGYYDPRKREIVVGNSGDYVAILLHEVNHFIFDITFDEAPVWLREGLAEYFETASASPDALVVSDQPHHRQQLAEWLRTTRQPDLRQLLALNWHTWRDHEREDGRRVRALSWSIVEFLMSLPEGRRLLQDFMATLKDQRGLYSLAALDRTFPGGAAAFERRWLEHLLAPTGSD